MGQVTIERKHSEIVRLFGTPKNIFAKNSSKFAWGGHYVHVYQCQDAFIRIRVVSIPYDASKMPQPNDKVTVLADIFTGGNQDFVFVR